MTWLKVDDALWRHPKFVGLSAAEHGWWLIGSAYSADQRTDGFVPKGVVTQRGGSKAAAALVRAGLWHEVSGGWMIHDFLTYNPSRQQLEERSARNARNGSMGGKETATRKQLAQRVAGPHASESRSENAAPYPYPVPDPSLAGLRAQKSERSMPLCGPAVDREVGDSTLRNSPGGDSVG